MPSQRSARPAPFDEAVALPLAERIFAELLCRIYDGRLPSESIVNEALLAEEFGVSRGPVREAMRRLQGIQLITREPYVRARVVGLTVDSARELFEMRLALEGVACRLAAQRMADAEIQGLMADLEKNSPTARAPLADVERSAHKPLDFHERIVRACGNDRIIEALCGDLYHLVRLYRRRPGSAPERRKHAYVEHWQILRAIKARDDELAESLMRSHIEHASEHLFGAAGAQRGVA